ncbi:MAG: PorV/PorQ family protein [bacterium]|nr:MAG: PorV/PorQ family protein [bacterium]
MKKSILLILIVFLTFTINNTFGQSKAGTSAAQFLKIGVGARAIGMGEAFVALSNDALALYWNPAGLALLENVNLTTTHTEWFAGLYHDFVGAGIPLGDFSLGVSMMLLNSDEIEITTLEQPDGTGIYYDATDLSLAVSYARKLLDRFTVGITGKYIQQKLYNESASGLAIDVGTILHTGFHGLRIGMCLSNFGTEMKLDGRDLIVPYDPGEDIAITPSIEAKKSTEAWPLPANFRVGIAVDLLGTSGNSFISNESSRLTLALDGCHPTDNEERGNIGLEYMWNNRIALRMGYKYNYAEENLTFGGGFNIGLGRANFVIDYAWADFGRLEYVHRFTLGCAL